MWGAFMRTFLISKFPNWTFTDLAQIPSLDVEGAEGGWGDIDFNE